MTNPLLAFLRGVKPTEEPGVYEGEAASDAGIAAPGEARNRRPHQNSFSSSTERNGRVRLRESSSLERAAHSNRCAERAYFRSPSIQNFGPL